MKETSNNSTKKLRIRFAYPWTNETTVQDDTRYQFLREIVLRAGGESLKDAEAETVRLRAVQGENVAESIFGRLDYTDVLIADITNRNANVMLELGYGLALTRKKEIQHVFVMCETDYTFGAVKRPAPPSDLAGYLIVYYRNTAAPTVATPTYELMDNQAFASKMQSVLRAALDAQGQKP